MSCGFRRCLYATLCLLERNLNQSSTEGLRRKLNPPKAQATIGIGIFANVQGAFKTQMMDQPTHPACNGGSAETSSPRLAYVFVFECEMCKREVYAYYHADKPELDFPLTCRCGWEGTRAVLTPRKFSVKTLTHHYRNHSRTRTAATTVTGDRKVVKARLLLRHQVSLRAGTADPINIPVPGRGLYWHSIDTWS